MFYLCSCDAGPDGGIYLLDFNGRNCRRLQFLPLPETNYICFSPDHRTLYATWNDKDVAGVAALRINRDFSLSLMNKFECLGTESCHLVCDPRQRYLWSANYQSGSFTQFSLASGGEIKQLDFVVSHHGKGPNLARQETAHTHCTIITPDEKYLCVVDLGMDQILFYPLNDKGIDRVAKIHHTAPGAGPRHLLFSDNNRIAYVANELDNTVSCFSYCDGKLDLLDQQSTLPENCRTESKCAALRLSKSGKELLVSNRGYDSLAQFAILPDGKLKIESFIPSGGKSPRDFAWINNFRYLLCANEFSNTVTFFDASGHLPQEMPDAVLNGCPRPLYILEIKAN